MKRKILKKSNSIKRQQIKKKTMLKTKKSRLNFFNLEQFDLK